MPEAIRAPLGWTPSAAASGPSIVAWRLALGLDREVRKSKLLWPKEVMYGSAFGPPERPLQGENRAIWDRAMATRQDSATARPRRPLSSPAEKVEVTQLREWLLSDSLDWDVVEQARDEGWR